MAILQTTGVTGSLAVSSSGLTTGSVLFAVDGYAGRLFAIDDNLTGSLFSVNTIAGLPIIEAFSDNTVNIGKYNAEAIKVQDSGQSVSLGSGSKMYVSSSGRVGIGTTNPLAELHLNANGDDWLRFTSGSIDWRFREQGARLKIASGSTDVVTFRGTGDVGFGTTDPSNKVSIIGAASIGSTTYNTTAPTNGLLVEGSVGIGTTNPTGKLHIRDDNNNPTLILEDRSVSGDPFIRFIPTSSVMSFAMGIDDSDSDKFKISFSASNVANLGTNDYLTISASGFIGVGTNTPTSKLHIRDTNDAGAVAFRIQNYSTNAAASSSIFFTTTTTDTYNSAEIRQDRSAGNNLSFLTDNTSRLYISASGNIGVGINSPRATLQVNGNISGSSFTSSVSNAVGFLGTSSWAQTASVALTASFVNVSGLNAYVQGGNSFGANAMLGINDNYRLDIEQNGTASISITGSRVGIGTTNPAAVTLTVISSSRITEGGSSTGILQFGLADTLVGYNANIFNIRTWDGVGYFDALQTNGSSRYTLLAPTTGSVGIGTIAPTAKLYISGSPDITTVLGLRKGSGSISQNLIYALDYNGNVNYLVNSDQNGHLRNALFYNNIAYLELSSYWPTWINNVNFNNGCLGIGTNSQTHGYGIFVNNLAYNSGSLKVETSTAIANRYVLMGDSSTATGVFTARSDDNSLSYIKLQNLDSSATTNHGIGIRSEFSDNTGSVIVNAGGLYWLKEQQWTNNTISRDSALTFHTTENGTGGEKIRITSGGNVGIGTSVPQGRLHISGSDSTYMLGISGTTKGVRFNVSSTGTFIQGVDNTLAVSYQPLILGGSDLYFQSNGTTTNMFLSASGDFGINTTTPAYKLDVNGPASQVSVGNQPYILARFRANVDGRALIRVDNSNVNSTAAATHAGISFLAYSTSSNNPAANTHEAQIILGGTGTGTSDLKFIAPLGMTFWTSASNVIMTGSGYLNYGQQAIAITPGGYVGIGTASPTVLLELSSSTATTLLNIKGVGGTSLVNVSGSGNIGIGTSPVSTYRLQVNGAFAASTKSFVIDHPTKPDKKLVYGSLESPYHGIRLTGKSKTLDTMAVILLPDYINKLVRPESVNIQLTPIKSDRILFVDAIDIENNKFTVRFNKSFWKFNSDIEFFWDFTAIRNDVEELVTEV